MRVAGTQRNMDAGPLSVTGIQTDLALDGDGFFLVERGGQEYYTRSGAFQFKKHQGFEPRPLNYRYHLVRNSGIPDFTPSNPKTRIFRSAWTHLPTWAVRMLSDRLARFLP